LAWHATDEVSIFRDGQKIIKKFNYFGPFKSLYMFSAKGKKSSVTRRNWTRFVSTLARLKS